MVSEYATVAEKLAMAIKNARFFHRVHFLKVLGKIFA
jgi:hypothetical protein